MAKTAAEYADKYIKGERGFSQKIPVAVELGAGWYGLGPGGTAGITYSYAVPNVPLVVKPYTRANLTYDSDLAATEGNDGLHAWINVGIYLSYDISTLF